MKYETDLDKVAGGISLENPEYPDKGLKLPEMPRGIELAIESSDPEGVIGADGSITWPEQGNKGQCGMQSYQYFNKRKRSDRQL